MRKTYFVLTNRYCTNDSNTHHWFCDLPLDFANSDSEKYITVTNFFTDEAFTLQNGNWGDSLGQSFLTPHIAFHCPTLHDGNFNQHNYVCTCTEDVVPKTFPITSHPHQIEFWFEEMATGTLIKLNVPFIIELELIY